MEKASLSWRLFLWPPLLVTILLLVPPQAVFFWMSLHRQTGVDGVSGALTLDNYVRVLTDGFYLGSLWTTVWLSLAATLLALLAGFPTAYVLARTRSAWISALIVLLLVSSFVTIVIKVLGLSLVLGRQGVVNELLLTLALIDQPLTLLNNNIGVVIGLVQYTLPFLVMLLFSVIQTIPGSLEEAAELHGASRLSMFRRVVLPLAMPGLIAGSLIVFNLNMGAFTSAVLLGGGRVLTLPCSDPAQDPAGRGLSDRGDARDPARRSRVPHQCRVRAAGAASRGRSMKRLRQAFRDAPFWFAALAVYAFLLGPILAVILASFEAGQSYHFAFPPKNFSFEWYGKIPQRYLARAGRERARRRGVGRDRNAPRSRGSAGSGARQARGDGATCSPTSACRCRFPFVVTGVVFLQFYNQLAVATGVDLLGTVAGLVVAHVYVTIPYSIGTVGSVLVRANARLEEAARTLGASEAAVFRRVLLPTLRPGLFAGFFYAFIVSFGDVPISIFIASEKMTPLPVEIFSTLQFDFDPAILALSTIVVVFSALLIFGAQRLAGFDLVLPSAKQ